MTAPGNSQAQAGRLRKALQSNLLRRKQAAGNAAPATHRTSSNTKQSEGP